MALELAFVGAGGIARAHLANLSRMDDVHVRAVCDREPERAERAAEPWKAAAYTDSCLMLDEQPVDAAYICLPPGMHGSLELDLAERKIPFYVEKPQHLDLQVATEVEKVIRENSLVTSVGYQLRYSDIVQAAREYLSDRQVTLAQGFYLGGLPGAPWWRRKELSGGQVVEQSTHVYDMLRYLVGEVETVFALASTGAMTDVPDYDLEDASVAVLEFSNGAIGQVVTSCVLTDGGERQVGCRFDGRSFTVRLSLESLDIADRQGRRSRSEQPPEGGWMARADRAFIDAVRTGDPSAVLCPYADGLKTLAVTLAVERSLQSGEPVSPERLRLSAAR